MQYETWDNLAPVGFVKISVILSSTYTTLFCSQFMFLLLFLSFFFFLPIAALTLTSFYGKKLEDSPADSPADSQGEDGDNLVSIIKRRRILAAKAAQEKEKRELERRLQ